MPQTQVAQPSPRLRKTCLSSDPLTLPKEILTVFLKQIKFFKHRERDFTACIVYTMIGETNN